MKRPVRFHVVQIPCKNLLVDDVGCLIIVVLKMVESLVKSFGGADVYIVGRREKTVAVLPESFGYRCPDFVRP